MLVKGAVPTVVGRLSGLYALVPSNGNEYCVMQASASVLRILQPSGDDASCFCAFARSFENPRTVRFDVGQAFRALWNVSVSVDPGG